jgi:hypothetical protein
LIDSNRLLVAETFAVNPMETLGNAFLKGVAILMLQIEVERCLLTTNKQLTINNYCESQ